MVYRAANRSETGKEILFLVSIQIYLYPYLFARLHHRFRKTGRFDIRMIDTCVQRSTWKNILEEAGWCEIKNDPWAIT